MPILTIGRGKTKVRFYHYPDIVWFKQYLREKRKNQGYDAYHQQIQTIQRKKTQELLENNLWTSEQVCDYLGIDMNTLNGLATRNQIKPIFIIHVRHTRLFFIPDVKVFKIDYDAYRKFSKKK